MREYLKPGTYTAQDHYDMAVTQEDEHDELGAIVHALLCIARLLGTRTD